MKNYIGPIIFIVILLSANVSKASDSQYSVCRFEEGSMEIFGLAVLGYLENDINSNVSNIEFGSWYLIAWKNSEDQSLVVKSLAADATKTAFVPAHEYLKTVEDVHAYALVWKDKSQNTKYGKSSVVLHVNAGFKSGFGYDVLYNAEDINMEAVEAGCGVNLLLFD